MNSPTGLLVIAYYTQDTSYEQEAQRLTQSLLKHNIRHHIAAVPNLGSWQKNTQFKAQFILDTIKNYNHNERFLYLDADAEVLGPLDLFDDFKADVAIHLRKGHEPIGSTIYFEPTDPAMEVLRCWIKLCEEMPNVWDQVTLWGAIRRTPEAEFRELPPEYCCIFDIGRKDNPGIQPVILQHQASRRLKKEVDG